MLIEYNTEYMYTIYIYILLNNIYVYKTLSKIFQSKYIALPIYL